MPKKNFCISAVIAKADEVAGLGEGIPGEVEPGGAGEKLVGESVGSCDITQVPP